jgi:hypothetical protein
MLQDLQIRYLCETLAKNPLISSLDLSDNPDLTVQTNHCLTGLLESQIAAAKELEKEIALFSVTFFTEIQLPSQLLNSSIPTSAPRQKDREETDNKEDNEEKKPIATIQSLCEQLAGISLKIRIHRVFVEDLSSPVSNIIYCLSYSI